MNNYYELIENNWNILFFTTKDLNYFAFQSSDMKIIREADSAR